MTTQLPYRHIGWARALRIVPGRFPPIGYFDRVADPADLDAVNRVESLTDPSVREERGTLSVVPAEERVAGEGRTSILAAFAKPAPFGNRFSPGTCGAYYAARDEQTAIAESVFHRERFLQFSQERPLRLQMVMYAGEIDGRFADIRGLGDKLREVYSQHDYTASQALGSMLRSERAQGIVYDSVRHRGGQCVAVFRPSAIGPVTVTRHLEYAWNGDRITAVLSLESLSLEAKESPPFK